MSEQVVSLLLSAALGFVGGFTAILVGSKDWADLKTFAAFKRYILGAIVGGLYSMLHSDYGFPNTIMTFVSGYAGTDFIDKLVERMQKKPEGEAPS